MTLETIASTDALSRRRSLPPGGTSEMRRMSDGWPVRTMSWAAAQYAPGSVLFLGGRADFIEKYSEALWVWSQDWGAGVVALDWRGQGLSGRLNVDPMRGHVDSFDRWVDDLDAVIDWFVTTMPGPHVTIGHSMGGHLLVRHLARGGSPLSRAALLAPLFRIKAGLPTGPLPQIMVALGAGGRFAPFQHPYGAWQQRPERQVVLTSDAERFEDEHWWIRQNPALALGGVTWGWLDAAARSLASLRASQTLEQISQPVLALSGERERLVDPEATRQAMRRIPLGQFETMTSAAHELLRESTSIQRAVHARLRAFLFGRPL